MRFEIRAALRWASSTALVAALGAAATAQAGPAGDTAPVDVFSESIDVRLLDLEVVVTDSEGERVRGLPREAFEVRVDGRRVPLVHFEEVDRRAGGPAPTPAARDPQPPSNAAEAASESTHFLVFIDDLMALERNRDLVLRRLRDELAALREGDSMAVVRFGGRKLHVLSGWSSDRTRLDAAIARALEEPSWGIKHVALRRMDGYVANWEGNDTRRSVLAAAAALRAVPAPSGRRALLLVAGGWDPLETDRADRFSPFCVSGWCQGSDVYDVLGDTANLLGYAIYAVDVEGRDPVDWGREERLQAVLGGLARVTGGRALLDGDRRRMLSAASADTASYYSLAVRPPEERDDRRHGIEVRVLRPGLTVRNLAAFVPLSPERARVLDVYNALFLEPSGDSVLRLRLAGPQRAPKDRMEVTAAAALPARALRWTERGGRWSARFALETATVDIRGNASGVEVRELHVDRASLPGPDETIVLPLPLDLRRRRHSLAVFVRDHQSDAVLTATAEISPRPDEP